MEIFIKNKLLTSKKILALALCLSITTSQANAAISWNSIKNAIDSITWDSTGKAISSLGNSISSSSWSSIGESIKSFAQKNNFKAPTWNTSKWDTSNTLTTGLALAATSYAVCTLWPYIKSKFETKKNLAEKHFMPITITEKDEDYDTNEILHAGLKSSRKRSFLANTLLQAGLTGAIYLTSPLAYNLKSAYIPTMICAIGLSVYRLGKVAIKKLEKLDKQPRTIRDCLTKCTQEAYSLNYKLGELKDVLEEERQLNEEKNYIIHS